MTRSTHSPEAIAAYPEHHSPALNYCELCAQVERARTAFDAGVAATHAQQYATTREALAKALHNLDGGEAETWDMGEWVQAYWLTKADALLATPGPLLDAAEVWAEGVMAKSNSSSIFDRDVLAKNPYREARP